MELNDAGDVERILAAGESEQIKAMFKGFHQIDNKDYAEFICEQFFDHPDPDMRLAVVIALTQIATKFKSLSDWMSIPFLAREFALSKENKGDNIASNVLIPYLYEICNELGDVFEDVQSELLGCGKPTSCVFIGDSTSPKALKQTPYYDLVKESWDYSKNKPCGSMIDNIDGKITWYVCKSCSKNQKDL